MKKSQWKAILALGLLVALLAGIGLTGWAEEAETPEEVKPQADYTVEYWVEKANIMNDPGDPIEDPEAVANFEMIKTETKSWNAGEEKALAAEDLDQYIRTEKKGYRYASFLSGETGVIHEDGSTVLKAYFKRDEFLYEFDLNYENAEMEIFGNVYTGGEDADKYSFTGKYEQYVVIPGLDNHLMPVDTTGEAYCGGWTMDERTELKSYITYEEYVSEDMLPTELMPYADELVYVFKGKWFTGGTEQRVLTSWLEELPEEQNDASLERMTYNGKVYVRHAELDFEYMAPQGSKPEANSEQGFNYSGRVDPAAGSTGPEANTWGFIYERAFYNVLFDTLGGEELTGYENVMTGQAIKIFNPEWDETKKKVDVDGTEYVFAGWFTAPECLDEEEFVFDDNAKMPGEDLKLFAKWMLPDEYAAWKAERDALAAEKAAETEEAAEESN